MDKPRILLISSASPLKGAGRVALDYYKAFKQEDYNIDFLTLYPVEGVAEIKYVYSKVPKLRKKINRFLYSITGLRRTQPGYFFFYSLELLPPVPVRKVLRNLNDNYELILILFWQDLLSFKTVRRLFEIYHCQIHFMGVDYSQMSGGCHFTRECKRYEQGCGGCPAIFSNRIKDFTYFNVRYREKIYNLVHPVVYGNTYMLKYFYSFSYLLRKVNVEQSYDIFDMEEFHPMSKTELRLKFGIHPSKRFIIFFGCQHLDDPRKGISYLLASLDCFKELLNHEERESIQLIVAGNHFDLIADKLSFSVLNLGFVDMKTMPELYSLADVFLSPSIDDAGPMMVNQALCCGTPVVAFEMGTALESIKDKPTGYCAKMKDVIDFAKGIETIYRLSEEKRMSIRNECRQYSVNTFSYSARVRSIMNNYHKYEIIR